ncbi:MAG TPA: hypothetical protein DHV62_00895 [Elusimicrobia bacterium]|jgi:PAS domain S-box-containing protein|nr:hypothetical protein [Elusimicrobiota bacterium]
MIDSLIVINPDATIRTINRATVELLGYEEKELIGKLVGIIFAEEFKDTKLRKLIQQGVIRNYEMKYRTKEGESIPVSFSGSVMRDKGGSLVGIVGIAVDMREIKQLQEQLVQSEKLAGLGQLAAGVAHELNNPLAGILGNTQLLLLKVSRAKVQFLLLSCLF